MVLGSHGWAIDAVEQGLQVPGEKIDVLHQPDLFEFFYGQLRKLTARRPFEQQSGLLFRKRRTFFNPVRHVAVFRAGILAQHTSNGTLVP